jgi:hypothetical protein
MEKVMDIEESLLIRFIFLKLKTTLLLYGKREDTEIIHKVNFEDIHVFINRLFG